MKLEQLKKLELGTKVFVSGFDNNGFFIDGQATLCGIVSASRGSVHIKRIGTGSEFVVACSAITKIYVKKKREYPKEIWVNCYAGDSIACYKEKEIADKMSFSYRIENRAIRYVVAKDQKDKG